MARVEKELHDRGATDFAAHFTCALALCSPHEEMLTFTGEVHGSLSFPPRGDHGFGYDPIFIATGTTETFAQMEPHRKHAMSHRARAFEKLLHSGVFTESL